MLNDRGSKADLDGKRGGAGVDGVDGFEIWVAREGDLPGVATQGDEQVKQVGKHVRIRAILAAADGQRRDGLAVERGIVARVHADEGEGGERCGRGNNVARVGDGMATKMKGGDSGEEDSG